MMRIVIPLMAIVLLLGASCSSAPQKPEGEFGQKNQAVEFAESGNKYYNQGLYDQALSFFNLSLAYNGSVYNEKGMVESYNSMGKAYLALGSIEKAQAMFDKALLLAQRIKDTDLIATCLNNTGELFISKKEYDKALDILEKAVNAGSGIKSERFAVIYHNLGTVYKRLGKPELAITNFQNALSINLQNKNLRETGTNYYMLSSTYSEKGDYVSAIEFAIKALGQDKQFENSLGIAKDFYALGILSSKSGNDTDAYQYFKNSLFIYDSLVVVRPAIMIKEEKKTLLDSLVTLAQKIDGDAKADEYRKLRKALD
jgi:tetratricopeptide (TPR) repeat protein